ncbi:MAG TPA: hypothetical protein VGR43_03785 [Dehalococcoidia bacterium]|nr:hypothetical protein [Dehalococcoidia bacterium]
MTPLGTVDIVTCGQCGQRWQRASGGEGRTIECIFCGRRGRLSIGADADLAPSSPRRVEAWLMQ